MLFIHVIQPIPANSLTVVDFRMQQVNFQKNPSASSHDSSPRDFRESNCANANFQSPIIATVASGDFCESGSVKLVKGWVSERDGDV